MYKQNHCLTSLSRERERGIKGGRLTKSAERERDFAGDIHLVPEKEKESRVCRSYYAFAGVVAGGGELGRREQRRPVVVLGPERSYCWQNRRLRWLQTAEETFGGRVLAVFGLQTMTKFSFGHFYVCPKLSRRVGHVSCPTWIREAGRSVGAFKLATVRYTCSCLCGLATVSSQTILKESLSTNTTYELISI